MTSLSYDVKIPLTTLIGYMDAAHKGIVIRKGRDDYIETARWNGFHAVFSFSGGEIARLTQVFCKVNVRLAW